MKYLILIILTLLTNSGYSQKVLYAELNDTNWDIYSISLEKRRKTG